MIVNGKNIQISRHFNSNEFKCPHCGAIKTDIDLVCMLESLFAVLHEIKYIIVNSGYRCAPYDKQIGGFVGKHNAGIAADVKAMGKDGKWIDSRRLLCILQDLYSEGGFAYINDKSIHVDARKGSRYLGDERKSNNTVTTDFYQYFGLSKSYVYGK